MTLKYEFMAGEEGVHTVAMMTRTLGVAASGYYRWRKQRLGGYRPGPDSREGRRRRLAEVILECHEASRGIHGIRRIRADLTQRGVKASPWLVAKLMRELGIQGAKPRGRKRTTIPAEDAPFRRDLIRRSFRPPVPTTNLVGDITYLKTSQGWLFLAVVIDLTTRMVVGWATAPHMRTELITKALVNAHDAGYVAGGAIFHSDRGAQYTSAEFAKAARLLDVRLSVGRTGVCWDNAVAESFFASLKKEMFHHRSFITRDQAHLAIADYIEVIYNRIRRHSTLAYHTPAARMAAFTDRITQTATTAA